MNLKNLLKRLKDSNIQLQNIGDQLKIIAPKGTVTKDLVIGIKENKDQLIRILQSIERKNTYTSITPVEKKEYYVLSSAQKRMYFLQQLYPKSTGYNTFFVLPLGKDIEKDKLETSLRKLITRHESLRTSFIPVNEVPVQKVHDKVEFEIEYYDLYSTRVEGKEGDYEGTGGLAPLFISAARSSHPAASLISSFIRPFDLSRAPLLRSGLIKLPDEHHFWLVDSHHIISDGTSQIILKENFVSLYKGEKLESLRIQYKDFCQWQERLLAGKEIDAQETYWWKLYTDGGEISRLDLPTDFKRPAVFTFEGARYSLILEKEDAVKFKALGARNNGTLFMNLLAALDTLFYKYTGQTDIVIGTGIAGRPHAELQQIVGMFINTLPIRNYPEGEKTYDSFLKEVIAHSVKAFENQDLPFETLVEKLAVPRDPSRNPIFDIAIEVWNYNSPVVSDEDLTVTGIIPGYPDRVTPGEQLLLTKVNLPQKEYENHNTKFDMSFFIDEQGEEVHIIIEYYTGLFRQETIRRLALHFKNVINAVSRDPSIKLQDINILSKEEKKQILLDFNDTRNNHTGHKKIHELFEEQAKKIPGNIALVGPSLKTENRVITSITYSALNMEANNLARQLRAADVKSGSIVAIMVERSIEMIIWILGILKAGGAYLPIDTDYPGERILYMLIDSKAKILLTTPSTEITGKVHLNMDIFCLEMEISRDSGPAHLAYVIYTSGSTGKPKGVMVEHQNVTRLVRNPNFIKLSPGDRLLLTGNIGFDITTFEIWGTLLNGLSLYLAHQQTILDGEKLKNTLMVNRINILHLVPQVFDQLISGAGGLEIFAGLKYFLVGGDMVRPEYPNELRKKFKKLKILHMYGPTENTTFSTYLPVEKNYCERIPVGKPVSHSWVCILDKYDQLQPIGVKGELCIGGGKVARGYMNSPELTAERFCLRRPGGRRMAHGALRSALCALRASPHKNFLLKGIGGIAPLLYRTGDLARWLPDGNIEFLGRIDQQVKIRGLRIEPEEIENQLMTHDEITEAVVVIRKDNTGDSYLCAYIVTKHKKQDTGHVGTQQALYTNDTLVTSMLQEYLSQSLPGYMIPVYFVSMKEIPLTVNGKVNRELLPEPQFGSTADLYQAPGNEIEKILVKIWSEVLGIDKTLISTTADFFQMGGHSLKAMILVSRVRKIFQVEFPLNRVFINPTIKEFATYIKKTRSTIYEDIRAVEKKEYYAQSSAQKRLFFLQDFENIGTAYNITGIIPLVETINKKDLETTFRELFSRHEILRTSFELINHEPIQKIHDNVKFEIQYYNEAHGAQSVEPKEQNHAPYAERRASTIKNFIRPFDLAQAPLLRVGLIYTSAHDPLYPPHITGPTGTQEREPRIKCILMVDIHHIIGDAVSINILKKEFISLYSNPENQLPPIRLQYKDFSGWQNSYKQKALVKQQEYYWLREFSSHDSIPVLNLPGDFPRPTLKSFEGNVLRFVLPEETVGPLKNIAAENNVTFYMAVLSIYTILLSKLSGQADIIVGTQIAGRRHVDLQSIIGMFVNTLAMRNFPTPGKTFKTFLKEVKERAVAAFENQDLPFEDLVDKLSVRRDTGRNPIFDANFNLIEMPDDSENPREYEKQDLPGSGSKTAKFDLNLHAINRGGKFFFTFEYSSKLFKQSTIERFIGYFNKAIALVTAHPNIRLGQIDIISREEKQQILYDFNDTNAAYPKDKVLHQLFEDQAEKEPGLIALAGNGQGTANDNETMSAELVQVTYNVVNRMSNRLARALKTNNTGPNQLVAVIMERSVETVIAVMGIIKAGAAYVPMEPYWPEQRVQKMLASLNVRCAIVSPSTQSMIETISGQLEHLTQLLCLDKKGLEEIGKHPGNNTEPTAAPGDMAYVIFTSGSTGMPKGVVETHRPVVNIIDWVNKTFSVGPWDKLLFVASLSFDLSVYDIFGILSCGGSLRIVPAREIKDPVRLLEIIIKEGITFWDSAPAALQQLLPFFDEFAPGVKQIHHCWRLVFLSGDWIPVTMPDSVRKSFPRVRVVALGGATEASIWSNFYPIKLVDPSWPSIPYGKPTQNARYYILDQELHLMPIRVAGDLYIGGQCLATGYINEPELTAGKFLGSPFLPHEKIYKTGDMARWFEDGNIQFLGRKDFQVKIRGYRIELGEIENQLLNHPLISNAIVIVKTDSNNNQFLCGYYITGSHDEEITGHHLREHLKKELPDYMIPSYFIAIDKIPLSPNGKLDRKGLPAPKITADDDTFAAPGGEIEKRLVKIWSEVLEIEATKLSIDANFFELGGHSLKAAVLVSRIHKELEVKLPLAEVFNRPFIREQARYIKKTVKNKYESLNPVEKKEYYALSSAQKRLYFVQHLDLKSTSYNMPLILPLGKDIGKNQLESTLKKLIARHESLRTSFIPVNGITVQKIHDEVEFRIEYYDLYRTRVEGKPGDYEGTGGLAPLPKEPAASTIKNFIRPFDLSQAPLLRSGLIKLPDGNHTWIVDMHHIISDGTSLMVLTEDFFPLYKQEELGALRVQYKDFSQWQNRLFEKGEIEAQEKYWLDLYADAGEIPRLDLPADFKRPEVFTFEGDRYDFMLEGENTAKFKALGSHNNGTLFMNILAALHALFYKYSGQTDIIIGSAIAGRTHADLQQIVGMFINKLAMRNYPEGEKTYGSFLKEVIAHSVKAFENQDVQFEALVDKLAVERDIARNPLFDISMVVQNFRRAAADQVISKRESTGPADRLDLEYKYLNTKYDMTFFVFEEGQGVRITIEYYTGLFKPGTIGRLALHFNNIVKAVVKEPSIKLKDIEIISPQEKQQVLYQFNDTSKVYRKHKTLDELFIEQVEKTPDTIAVIGEALYIEPGDINSGTRFIVSVSYAELNRRARQLAYYLYREKHVRPDEPVGILMQPSINIIVAIMGILKAGGAYVPLAANLPGNRLKQIIRDARIEVIISQKACIRLLNRLQWECESFNTFLCMDSTNIHLEEEEEKNELMNEKLWEYVGSSATDDITGGGWVSSYSGEPFSREEMDEYGDNILVKLNPALHHHMRVLEIGCASGITMYRIAPKVGFYCGTDLSQVIIEKNKKQIKQEGHDNISLSCIPAHRIAELNETNFDLIILNSVIQNFHGHNYLRQVLRQCVNLLGNKGIIFIGDIMDQDLKEELVRELQEFKETHRDKNYRTTTDYSSHLFVSRAFWEDLQLEIPGIRGISFTGKIHTIENELTKFRYDTLITVDKRVGFPGGNPNQQKHKHQHDLSTLEYAANRNPKAKVKSPVKAGNLAYILYTSGSTGIPKGVMVEHRSVHNLIIGLRQSIYHAYEPPLNICVVSPYIFDASVKQIFAALLQGHSLFMVPENIRANGEELLAFYRTYSIDISDGTPTHLQLMLNCSTGNRLNHPVKHFLVGGEALPVETARVFLHQGRAGEKSPVISNVYGPSECCVDSTLYRFLPPGEIPGPPTTLPVGKPLANQHVYILDNQLKLQPIGVPGELCIGGDNLARGYLNRGASTENGFIVNPFATGERLYRTGDLARWLPDGNVEFLGRIDLQVKLRGYRIELQEIRSRLLKHEDIKEAVVIDREKEDGDKYLCAYIVSRLAHLETPGELKEYLSQNLPEYMIPSYFVPLEQIPLTPNGKLDRKRLPIPGVIAGDDYAAPDNEIEKQLVEIWSEVLNLEKSSISIDADFFQLGGHSLKATILVSKIHKKLDVKFPLAEVFKRPFIRSQARYIKESVKERYSAIQPVEKREYHELSSAQKRLYFVQQLDLNSTVYHMHYVLPLRKNIKKDKLESTLNKVVARHESLRTSFLAVNEIPVQKVHDEAEFRIEYYDLYSTRVEGKAGDYEGTGGLAPLPKEPAASTIKNFIRPFDFPRAPLLRSGLIKLPDENYTWIVDMHHIISDGTSLMVLIEDFISLYDCKELDPLRIQYKDFAQWQNQLIEEGKIDAQRGYWLELYQDAGTIPWLDLPGDFKRPEVFTFEGDRYGFMLQGEDAVKLNALGSGNNGTLYMNILAVLNALFYRYTGQTDIIIGTANAGRPHADLQQIVGMFVNTLPMRNYPQGEKTFEAFLTEVIRHSVKAFENQDVQFEDLVDQLTLERNLDRNPLFDIAMVVQNFITPGPAPLARETVPEIKYNNPTTKFDMTFYVQQRGDDLHITIEYYVGLFKQNTIQRLAAHFKNVVKTVVNQPSLKLQNINILSEKEKKQILFDFNDTAVEYPALKTIHLLFREEVERHPGQTAVSSYLYLAPIFDNLEPGKIDKHLKRKFENICFRKNSYIFRFQDSAFLEAMNIFTREENHRLIALRTHKRNYLVVNRELFSLLDYFDGKTNIKSLFKGISGIKPLPFLLYTLKKDSDETDFQPGTRERVVVGDNFEQMFRLVKTLLDCHLILPVGYNPIQLDIPIFIPHDRDEKRFELKTRKEPASVGAIKRSLLTPPQDHQDQNPAVKSPVLLLGDRTGPATVGLLYIASFLRRNGIETYCQWNDINLRKDLLKINVEKLLSQVQPRIVGISMKWFLHIARVLYICRIIKKFDPSITVVVGGNTASYYKEKIIGYDDIDYLIVGDGELPMLKLCLAEDHIPNCIYKKDGKVMETPVSYLQDETNSPGIYLSHLEQIFVTKKDPYLASAFYICTGKGCPMHCIYCGGCRGAQEKTFNRTKPFMRGIREVRNDIITAKKYTSTLFFDFDLPSYDSLEYYRKIWDGLDLSDYFCEFYFWKLPGAEFLDYVVKTFKYIYINIDLCSLSQPHRLKLSSLGLVKPQPTDEELFTFFDQCEKYDNIEVIITQINGLPYFSLEDITISHETLDKIITRYSNVKDLVWGRLHAQPGAPIMHNCEKYNMHSYATTFQEFLHHSKLNMAEDTYPDLLTINYPYIYWIDDDLNSKISKFYVDANRQVKNYKLKKEKSLNRVQGLTYAQLDEISDQLAMALRCKGVKPGTVVGVLMERSKELIAALLAVLKAGGAYLPLTVDFNYPGQRIAYMLADSNAVILLTQSDLLDKCKELGFQGEIIDIFDRTLFVTPSMEKPGKPGKQPASGNLAYVLYTSGSTGTPKGVMVEHQNVIPLVKNTNYIHPDEGDRLLLTGDIVFDITTFEIWGTLLNGLNLLLADQEIILDGKMLKNLLVEYRVDIMHLVPQLFNRLAQEPGGLDIFAGLKYFLVGGDLVRPAYVNELRKQCKKPKILHMYGPTENTTFSTYFPVDKDYQDRIPIGKPISNSSVYILDPRNYLQPIGVVGELGVGGKGVARGYLNNPELTAERFCLRRPGGLDPLLYRTGDLARWLPDGNIQFVGRADHQVKIRGMRIELLEIENRLLKHEAIKEAAVIDREIEDGDKYLCAYIVSDIKKPGEIKEYLSHSLPGYMIPSYFVFLDKIPLTPTGKPDRNGLPTPGIIVEDSDAYAAPGNRIEKVLVEIWSDVLGIEAEKLSIDVNFFQLGGHSLKGITLISKIHKKLGVKLPLQEMFKTATIRGQARYIHKAGKDKYTSMEPVEKKEYYELSSAQKRMYFMQQLDLKSTAYNRLFVIPLGKEIEKEKLEYTLNKLTARHESLRTSFLPVNGIPVQKIHDKVESDIEYYDLYRTRLEVKVGDYEGTGGLAPLPNEPAASMIKNFIRPFDLSQAPLLRSGLIKLPDNNHTWIVDVHHIISDGTSHLVITRDFKALYNQEELEPLKIQYKDFTRWQNLEKEKTAIKKQENYWLKCFAGGIPQLNMFTDFTKPGLNNFAGEYIPFFIEKDLTKKLKQLTRSTGTTLFMVLLTGYYILVSIYSKQDDIVVGSPVSGRRHTALQNIMGMFVNMLPLRNRPEPNKTAAGFLMEVKKGVIAALENQDYQFEDLVVKLGLQGNISGNPLFNVVFAMQNPGQKGFRPTNRQNPFHGNYHRKNSAFDLLLSVVETGDMLKMGLEYSTQLFVKSKAEKIIQHYKDILEQLVENKNIKIKDITISHQLLTASSNAWQQQEIAFEF